MFVPNTFTPNDDEHNELFKPITSFVSELGYTFSIYTRNGQLIFLTSDPNKGWDGTYERLPVQNGDYVYHIEYIDGVGQIIQKTGVVSLIR